MNVQLRDPKKPLFLAVTGPTAAGKTEFSLLLAEELGCDIVCVDAMQVYKSLDIGTAKPTPAEQQRARHYGIDLVPPLEQFNAKRYCDFVEPILQDAWQRQVPLVLCGGTGLYFRALLEGFFDAPAADFEYRDRLQVRIQEEGCNALFLELKKRDPQAAERVHPNDVKRLIRTLEIIHTSGKTIAELRQSQQCKPWIHHARFIGLTRSRDELLQRIAERTRWMYGNGLVEETRQMIRMGCTPDHTAMQALGYKECYACLQGSISLSDAVDATITGTVRYAKRQMTWFKHQFNTQWIELKKVNNFQEIVKQSLQESGFCGTYDRIV